MPLAALPLTALPLTALPQYVKAGPALLPSPASFQAPATVAEATSAGKEGHFLAFFFEAFFAFFAFLAFFLAAIC